MAGVSLLACGDDGGDDAAVASDARQLTVTADDFSFDPAEITVTAGEDTAITLTSVDLVHDVTIDQLGLEIIARAGNTRRAGLRAQQPGRYTFYCAQPGHREAGMEGTLIVEATR